MKQSIKIAVTLLCVGLAIALYRTLSPGGVPPTTPRVARPAAIGTPRAPSAGAVIHPLGEKWVLRQQAPARATIEESVANDLPTANKHDVHLIVTAVDPRKFWAAQMVKVVPQPLKARRQMVVRFWGRSAQSTPVWVIFEEGRSPHTPDLQKLVTLTPEWREYSLPFRTSRDHVDPHANFCIKAGIKPGEIEVADIRVD